MSGQMIFGIGVANTSCTWAQFTIEIVLRKRHSEKRRTMWSQASWFEISKQGAAVGAAQDGLTLDLALPRDAANIAEASHVKTVQISFLSHMCCPCLQLWKRVLSMQALQMLSFYMHCKIWTAPWSATESTEGRSKHKLSFPVVEISEPCPVHHDICLGCVGTRYLERALQRSFCF